jgi:hypothetical protein
MKICPVGAELLYADRRHEADVAFVVLQVYLKTQPSVIAWMQVEYVQTVAVCW